METRDIESLSGEEKASAEQLFWRCSQKETPSTQQLEEVDQLLKQYPDLVAVKSKEHFPLYRAAVKGHEALCQKLLDCGADVDAKDSSGKTALMAAATYGRDAVCELLLNHGALIDIQDNLNYTALSYAASAGHKNTCEFLIENGASLSKGYLLHAAAVSRKTEICRLMLNQGIAVNQPDEHGNTALHIAAGYGRDDTCRYLIAQGAEIDSLNNRNHTPLWRAALGDEKGAGRVLLLEGANPNLKDSGNSQYRSRRELINAIIQEEKDKAEKNFRPDTPPTRRLLFTGAIPSDAVKGACLTGYFSTHIARPLLQSKDPEHADLLHEVLQSLPNAWKNATAHQYTLLERQVASRQFDPLALR